MKKIIIFGLSDYAELAHYYIEHDTEYEVVAFSVHKKYMPEDARFKNLPVVEFEDVEKIFSPAEFKFFAPMSPKNMNRDREKIFFEIKNKGYQFISYVSSKATVFENQIGDNCFILEDNTIQSWENRRSCDDDFPCGDVGTLRNRTLQLLGGECHVARRDQDRRG